MNVFVIASFSVVWGVIEPLAKPLLFYLRYLIPLDCAYWQASSFVQRFHQPIDNITFFPGFLSNKRLRTQNILDNKLG
jgi:hypothetical protein